MCLVEGALASNGCGCGANINTEGALATNGCGLVEGERKKCGHNNHIIHHNQTKKLSGNAGEFFFEHDEKID